MARQQLRLTKRAERMFDEQGVPGHIRDALRRWVLNADMGGHFIEGLLTNNLTEAITQADLVNRRALYDIVIWLYNNTPSGCWGSKEKVKARKGCMVEEGVTEDGHEYSFYRIPEEE